MPPRRDFQGLGDALSALFDATISNPPSRTTAFDLESIRSLKVVDRFIPTSTLYLFLDFMFEGSLYDGRKTSLPLIREDEVPFLVRPYVDWAPTPWNGTSSSLQERILNVPEYLTVTVDRRISGMRARLWEGMVPMSGARWKEKKLDDWTNWQFAFDFLLEIVHTFVWLGDPDTQIGIKNEFNYIAKNLETWQSAINARRAQNDVEPRIDATGMWLEFIASLFETMVTRTHTWFLDRVNEIVTEAKSAYNSTADAKGDKNSYEAAKKFGEPWADLNRLLSRADFAIMMPMDGFLGFTPSTTSSMVVGSLFPLPLRRDQMNDLEAAIPWPLMETLIEDVEAVYTDRIKLDGMVHESATNRDKVRTQLRGASTRKLGREPWISVLKSRTKWSLSHGGPQDQKWGFVCYMLSHKPGPAEWVSFRSKLHIEASKSGEWIEGFDEVKQNMGLQWVHGKDSGLAHDSIEDAKRHFRAFSTSPRIRKRAWKLDFLIVDTECFDSYMSPLPAHLPPHLPTQKPSFGDFGGFLKLIDTSSYQPELLAQTSPGFRNELKVLGSLIFDEIYPLITILVQRPRDLWPSAILHPNQVYVGPTGMGQDKGWEKVRETRELGWKAFCTWRNQQTSRTAR